MGIDKKIDSQDEEDMDTLSTVEVLEDLYIFLALPLIPILCPSAVSLLLFIIWEFSLTSWCLSSYSKKKNDLISTPRILHIVFISRRFSSFLLLLISIILVAISSLSLVPKIVDELTPSDIFPVLGFHDSIPDEYKTRMIVSLVLQCALVIALVKLVIRKTHTRTWEEFSKEEHGKISEIMGNVGSRVTRFFNLRGRTIWFTVMIVCTLVFRSYLNFAFLVALFISSWLSSDTVVPVSPFFVFSSGITGLFVLIQQISTEISPIVPNAQSGNVFYFVSNNDTFFSSSYTFESFLSLIPFLFSILYVRSRNVCGRTGFEPGDRTPSDIKDAIIRSDIVYLDETLQHDPEGVWKLSDSDGSNVLHICVLQNRPIVLKFLLNWPLIPGGLVSATDKNGMSPFLLAAHRRSPDFLKLLAISGANIREVSSDGEDALTLLKHSELSLTAKLRHEISSALALVWEQFRTWAKYISLAFMLCVSLVHADGIHGLFLAFFLVFVCHPFIQMKMWNLLVLYSQISVVLLYLSDVWTDFRVDLEDLEIKGDYSHFDSIFWTIVGFLIIALLQKSNFSVHENVQQPLHVTHDKHLSSFLRKVDSINLKWTGGLSRTDREHLWFILKNVFIYCSPLVLYTCMVVAAFSNEPAAFKWSYLLFLVFCTCIHLSTNPSQAYVRLRISVSVFVPVCLLIAIVQYLFQYQSIIDGLSERSRGFLRQLGFVKNPPDEIFWNLLPQLVVFASSIVVVRVLSAHVDTSYPISGFQSKWLEFSINLGALLRELVFHLAPHLNLVFSAIIAFYRPDIIGIIYLVSILIILPVSYLRSISWIPLSMIASISICVHYIFEVKYAGTFWSDALEADTGTWHKWGIGSMDQKFWEADGLILEVILLMLCVVERLSDFVRDLEDIDDSEAAVFSSTIPKTESQLFLHYVNSYFRHHVKNGLGRLYLETTIYLLIVMSFARLNVFSIIFMGSVVLVYVWTGPAKMRESKGWIFLVSMLTFSIFYQYLAIVFREDIQHDILNQFEDSLGKFLAVEHFSSEIILYDFLALYFAILHQVRTSVSPEKLKGLEAKKPLYWKNATFAILFLSDKLVLCVVFLLFTTSMDFLRIPVFCLCIHMLFRCGISLHSQSHWKSMQAYISGILFIMTIYQIPSIPNDFDLQDSFNNFSWENVTGLKKLSLGSSFTSHGVIAYIISFILIDIQLQLYQLQKYKEEILISFYSYHKMARFRSQESFFQYQESIKNLQTKYRNELIQTSQNLEQVFSDENKDKISWNIFPDEELWPFSAKSRDTSISETVDLNTLDTGAFIIGMDYKIQAWNSLMSNLTNLSPYQVVQSEYLLDEQLPKSPNPSVLASVFETKLHMSPFIFVAENAREKLHDWVDALFEGDTRYVNSLLPLQTTMNVPKELLLGDGTDFENEFPVHVQVWVEARKDVDENIIGAVVLFKELVEMRAQYVLRDLKEDHLQVLGDQEPSFLVNADGMISRWNRRFELLFDSIPLELSSISIRKLFEPSTAGQMKDLIAHLNVVFDEESVDAAEYSDGVDDSEHTEEMRMVSSIFGLTGATSEHIHNDSVKDGARNSVSHVFSFAGSDVSNFLRVLVSMTAVKSAENINEPVSSVKCKIRLLNNMDKINTQIRTWKSDFQHFIHNNSDHSIFKTLSWDEKQKTKKQWHSIKLAGLFLLSQTAVVIYSMVILQLLIFGSLVHTVIPIIILIYALLENPYCSKGFWIFIFLFEVCILLLKLLYQLDVFCTTFTGDYSFQPNHSCINNREYQQEFETRTDFAIGIRKAVGGNITSYIFLEFAILILVAIHRYIMERKGVWEFKSIASQHEESMFVRKMRLFFSPGVSAIKQAALPHSLLIKLFSNLKNGPSSIQRYFYGLVPLDPFNTSSVDSSIKPGKDFYAPIFISEMICFLYTLFFWGAIDASGGNLTTSLTRSRFPGQMVLFLFLQAGIMISDRIIYLYRSVFNKINLQYFTVVFYHYFLFLRWPDESSSGFQFSAVLVIFYLIKLVYWVFSGLQIRYGYRNFTGEHNLLTKRVSAVRKILISVFYSIPMLYELRTLISWIAIPTSLDLSDTFLMEDIYYKVFLIKCDLDVGEEQIRGEPVKTRKKCSIGSCMVFLILLVLLGPLLLFSDLNPSQSKNNVTGSSIDIVISGDQGDYNILTISSLLSKNTISNEEYLEFQNKGILSNQNEQSNTQKIQYATFSDSFWTTTDEGIDNLLAMLENDNSEVTIQFLCSFTRPGPTEFEQVSDSTSRALTPLEKSELAIVLSSVVDDTVESASIVLSNLFPLVLQLPGTNDIRNLDPDDANIQYELFLMDTDTYRYWKLSEINTDSGVSIYTYSDPIFESGVSSDDGIGYGIVTFYVVVVLTIANFLRLQTTDQMYSIIYDEMLNVDDIHVLCEAVYVARFLKQFQKEETLFRILIRIFRSPEKMLKLTVRKNKS